MSMNVLERSREIGVLRAVGASNAAVLRLVIVEGMIIGLISWILAFLLSIPITLVLNAGVGAAILTTPLDFTFGLNGLVLWLGVVTVIAALASALPALNAMRLTVREVLAYE
jgi:putative ABC transport system permease protein